MTPSAAPLILSADRPLRVLTMNIWAFAEPYDDRMKVLRAGIAALDPDLMAFQEAGYDGQPHQVRDLLRGMDYHVLHQFDGVARPGRSDANGVAARWPLEPLETLSLQLTERSRGYPYAALAVRVAAPEPAGPILFVNAKPSWELDRELERELQAVAVARMIQRHADPRGFPTLLAGDFDATPDSASIRFWTGRQSLGGMSTQFLDAWQQAGDGSAGYTWTFENPYARAIIDRLIRQPRHARRIDYLFLGSPHHHARFARFRTCRVALDQPVQGVWASDHYAVYAEIDVVPTAVPPKELSEEG
ncbi:MAG: endonuclease/exonuclease/phosphatase family protein [Planctomycetes bacterium]|nr:endonuclease/exonuclease/phosphatase family protein [Planctomycetota bacterium]